MLISFLALTSIFKAQTSKELIGKWQLTEVKHNGKSQEMQSIFGTDQVFQIFKQDNSFEGIVGSKTMKGKWQLTKDNDTQVLEVSDGNNATKFKIEQFDAEKRAISLNNNGSILTLYYKKI